jgi:hypothetical protein
MVARRCSFCGAAARSPLAAGTRRTSTAAAATIISYSPARRRPSRGRYRDQGQGQAGGIGCWGRGPRPEQRLGLDRELGQGWAAPEPGARTASCRAERKEEPAVGSTGRRKRCG